MFGDRTEWEPRTFRVAPRRPRADRAVQLGLIALIVITMVGYMAAMIAI